MTDSNPDAACRGKTGYLTWEQANRVIVRTRRWADSGGRGRVGVYRCRHCSHWHIGHGGGQ